MTTASHLVPVDLGPRSYEIHVQSGGLSHAAAEFSRWLARHHHKGKSFRTLIVSDENVLPHARDLQGTLTAAGWEAYLAVQPPGETSKSLEVVSELYDRLIEMQADRGTVIVAVGGGVVGDAAGFIAATYARGLPFIQVPTTLLAAVDSSVGGKVGVNHPLAKNMIGAFHQPQGVLIDPATFETLPEREFVSGLAEVVKYGVILDARFFEWLEGNVEAVRERRPAALQHLIIRSCELKAQVVQQDEFERTGLRAILNYGHTFAHAYEALAEYGTLLHGEAVSIGMVHASRLAERRGLIPSELTRRQLELLKQLNLPVTLPAGLHLSVDDVIARMRLDKKSVAGKLRFILPTKLGHVELFADIPEEDVRAVLEPAVTQ